MDEKIHGDGTQRFLLIFMTTHDLVRLFLLDFIGLGLAFCVPLLFGTGFRTDFLVRLARSTLHDTELPKPP